MTKHFCDRCERPRNALIFISVHGAPHDYEICEVCWRELLAWFQPLGKYVVGLSAAPKEQP